ncbi:MAG: hypothetical protein ABSF94_18160 [Steroidobacteraceae bacterium]|jgi:hypothetical protein
MALSPAAKAALWTVSGLLVLVLAVPATLLLINLHDEPLNPQVQAVLDRKYDGVPPAENLFFALLALDSRDPADINAQGRRLYAEYLREHAASGSNFRFRFKQDAFLSRLPFSGSPQLLCGSAKPRDDCFARALGDRAELEELIEANRLLLDRYKALQQYRRLQNPVSLSINSLILQWQPFRNAKRLWLTDVALQIRAGKVDAGIDALQGDIAFTRRMLAEPDLILIDKMVLASSLRDSLQFLSGLVRDVPLSDAQYRAVAALLPPLTEDERSLAPVFVREFTGFANFLGTLNDPNSAAFPPSIVGRLQSKFLKYNATVNLKWSYVEKANAQSRGTCDQLPPAEFSPKGRLALPFYDYFYNPIGKVLVVTSVGSLGDFLEGMCDLEGMRRIVVLQTMLHEAKVTDDQVPAFLQRSGPDYGNPYTGLPLEWRPEDRTLTFKPLAPRDTNYFPWAI